MVISSRNKDDLIKSNVFTIFCIYFNMLLLALTYLYDCMINVCLYINKTLNSITGITAIYDIHLIPRICIIQYIVNNKIMSQIIKKYTKYEKPHFISEKTKLYGTLIFSNIMHIRMTHLTPGESIFKCAF